MEKIKRVGVMLLIAAAVVGYCIIVLLALYALSHLTPAGFVTSS